MCAALAKHLGFASIDEFAFATGSFCHEYLLSEDEAMRVP